MIAQFYTDTSDYVRVFNLKELAWRSMVMDCAVHESDPGLEAADAALQRCRLQRTRPWKYFKTARMYEAPVRFNRYTKKTNQ